MKKTKIFNAFSLTACLFYAALTSAQGRPATPQQGLDEFFNKFDQDPQ